MASATTGDMLTEDIGKTIKGCTRAIGVIGMAHVTGICCDIIILAPVYRITENELVLGAIMMTVIIKDPGRMTRRTVAANPKGLGICAKCRCQSTG